MIKQLRRKFITVTMLLVAVMLLSVFAIVNHVTFEEFKDHNLRILKGLDRPTDHKHESNPLSDRIPNMCFVLTQMPDGSLQVKAGTQVTLQLQRQGTKHCLLQVASRGQTLTSQQCRDIFKRFYRVDTVRTGSGSYGLGLSIALQITREHRGKIWCDGKDGVNTFYVRLPINKE